MGKYGQAAILAVDFLESNRTKSPREAWELATSELFGKGTHAQKKGCPRGAFLGLCEEGLVRGVAPGKYTESRDNKDYALQGLALLKQNPSFAKSPSALWKAIGINKSHNSQMDVVLSLWEKNYLLK